VRVPVKHFLRKINAVLMQKVLGVTVKNVVAHDLCTPDYLSLTTTAWRATVICKVNRSREAAIRGFQGLGLGVGPWPCHN